MEEYFEIVTWFAAHFKPNIQSRHAEVILGFVILFFFEVRKSVCRPGCWITVYLLMSRAVPALPRSVKTGRTACLQLLFQHPLSS